MYVNLAGTKRSWFCSDFALGNTKGKKEKNSLKLNMIYLLYEIVILYQVEDNHPGFAYDLVKAILRKADMTGSVDMSEALLRLEGTNNSRG